MALKSIPHPFFMATGQIPTRGRKRLSRLTEGVGHSKKLALRATKRSGSIDDPQTTLV